MNDDLKALHNLLLAQHRALSDKLSRETDPDKAEAILTEMQEILHRIDLVQGLLFRRSTKALTNALADVQSADTELTEAIRHIKDVASFVEAVADFLKYVDKAIDIAKTLAPLAA